MKKIMFNDKYSLTQAVLNGRKTQTRRIAKRIKYKPYEVIAVAKKYRDCGGLNEEGVPRWDMIAKAVGTTDGGWNNKMFVRADLMPHRIRITNVRIERLQDISDEDCLKEAIFESLREGKDNQYEAVYCIPNDTRNFKNPREAFSHLIDKVSGKGTWERNPYVFVYDFELVKP